MTSDSSGPKMLRMVRWQGVMQDAERLRNWRDVDREDAVSRTVHMGDPRNARKAVLAWADAVLNELEANPKTVRRDYEALDIMYHEFMGKIDGRLAVMDTELGYYSQNVGPEFDRAVYEFSTWCNTSNLRHLFSEGREVQMTGHMGAGKSHLAVLFMEYLLTMFKRPLVHVVTNIPGVKDTSERFNDRIHHVTMLSDILRLWSQLPHGCLMVIMIDEPEANLRGGSTRSVKIFTDFRHMIRKLGMSKVEIWHNESEQYKALREAEGEGVVRIAKDDKKSFDVKRKWRKDTLKQHVEGVHDLQFLRYAHRGMGSIDVDVDMRRLIQELGKVETIWDMKAVVKAAMVDDSYFLPEYRIGGDRASGAKKDSWEHIIRYVLKDVQPYLTRKRFIDHKLLIEQFPLTRREARELAREATLRWKESTPEWASVMPTGTKDAPSPYQGDGAVRPPRLRRRDDHGRREHGEDGGSVDEEE